MAAAVVRGGRTTDGVWTLDCPAGWIDGWMDGCGGWFFSVSVRTCFRNGLRIFGPVLSWTVGFTSPDGHTGRQQKLFALSVSMIGGGTGLEKFRRFGNFGSRKGSVECENVFFFWKKKVELISLRASPCNSASDTQRPDARRGLSIRSPKSHSWHHCPRYGFFFPRFF